MTGSPAPNDGPGEPGDREGLRILVLGYGNPGRQDDGLGPAAAMELDGLGLPNVTAYDNYQLNIEDALDVAAHDVVWFIDAARNGPPFAVSRLSPSARIEFTSHIVRPETILAIAAQYSERTPQAFLMAIRGYEFELEEALTPAARDNLRLALAALTARLRSAPTEVAS